MSVTIAPQLAPSARVVALTAGVVVLLHLGVVVLWHTRTATEPLRKPLDVTIEFFTPAPQPPTVSEPERSRPDPAPPRVVAQPTSAPVAPVSPSAPTPPSPEPARAPDARPAVESTAAAPAPEPVTSAAPSSPPTSTTVVATTNSDADYKAAYLNNPKPPYPLTAVRQGAQGRVVLWAEVLPDGRAGRVQVEKSSGHAMLDASAMNTVRAWRFTPARQDGVVTTQAVRIPIDFTLQDRR